MAIIFHDFKEFEEYYNEHRKVVKTPPRVTGKIIKGKWVIKCETKIE